MNKNPSLTKEIDQYLSGELSPAQKTEFEEKIRIEKGLGDEVEITRRLILAIKGYGFRQMLKRIHNEHIEELRNKVDEGS